MAVTNWLGESLSYDGHYSARYDAETFLSWMSVRVYDETLARFLWPDLLGRLAGFGPDATPYVYAGNNPPKLRPLLYAGHPLNWSSPRSSVLCSSGRSIQSHIFKWCVGKLPPARLSLLVRGATAHTPSCRSSVCRWSTPHLAP